MYTLNLHDIIYQLLLNKAGKINHHNITLTYALNTHLQKHLHTLQFIL